MSKNPSDVSRFYQDLRDCHKWIQAIAAVVKSMGSTGTMREIKMGQNVQTALATKVQSFSTTFRTKQSLYLKREFQDFDMIFIACSNAF